MAREPANAGEPLQARVRSVMTVNLFDDANAWAASGHIPTHPSGYVDLIIWGTRFFKVETPGVYREIKSSAVFTETP